MQIASSQILLSATDLVAFQTCQHRTWLDWRATTEPELRLQKVGQDEGGRLIAQRGIDHERAHLGRLVAQGLSVLDIAAKGGDLTSKAAHTLQAMQDGIAVIYQATLVHENMVGHADFLMRVDGAGAEGLAWHYEVADTKLARSPQPKFLVQLSFYSHLLAVVQGMAPANMHLVLGDGSQHTFRCADHAHQFQSLLSQMHQTLAHLSPQEPPTYPDPCAACDTCHWRARCEAQRLADDHLCQVANIRRVQWQKLQAAGIHTLAALATATDDMPEAVNAQRMQPQTWHTLHAQARLQHLAKVQGQRLVEVLPIEPEVPEPNARRGFLRLPMPAQGDLFFDMEGNPLEPGGLEYLFGVWHTHVNCHTPADSPWQFLAFWAHDRAQEKVAFEAFVDFAINWLEKHPKAHIYHYASYEETALKRLASLHATREAEVDSLLRRRKLVDLYKVVREGLRISEPSYSIKNVERFYRPQRAGDVQNAGASMVFYERWKQLGDPQLLHDIALYNRDDVESTQQLRDWLLTLRPTALPWFNADDDEAADESDRQKATSERLQAYEAQLMAPLPSDPADWSSTHHQQALICQLLSFHRRVQKPQWWAFFDRMSQDTETLLDDADCLAGLTLDPENPPRRESRSIFYTFCVPPQISKLQDGSPCTLTMTGESLGRLSLSDAPPRAVIKRSATKDSICPLPDMVHLGPNQPLEHHTLVGALYRLADDWLMETGNYTAIADLLARRPPNLGRHEDGHPRHMVGQALIPEGTDPLKGAMAAAESLQGSYLYIQGPPGTGKTFTGSRIIARLLSLGYRVGIMSNSHKAINHLATQVLDVAHAQNLSFLTVKKVPGFLPGADLLHPHMHVLNEMQNGDAIECMADLMAGTAWLFADPKLDQTLDYLFVDEAGQVSLANLLAAGTCARNLVLLGDQMQLSQPVEGVHPGRSGDSALDYLLDGKATIPEDLGIFLGTSYRMHPLVCDFISQAVYDGRLRPHARNAKRTLVLNHDAHAFLRPAGLIHVPMHHEGCSQSCPEEAQTVLELYASAMQQQRTDEQGQLHPMTSEHILVVAPYNVQVNLIQRTLHKAGFADARVGTVDKFQGQEAELVIVSMTTSGQDDLPRDIEFLYSKNRLNVAISRAKCLAVVLANPQLLRVNCQTVEQMALVNTLCWVAQAGTMLGARSGAPLLALARC